MKQSTLSVYAMVVSSKDTDPMNFPFAIVLILCYWLVAVFDDNYLRKQIAEMSECADTF